MLLCLKLSKLNITNLAPSFVASYNHLVYTGGLGKMKKSHAYKVDQPAFFKCRAIFYTS